VKSSPARIFVVGLVAMFILIGIAAVIRAIMNPHVGKEQGIMKMIKWFNQSMLEN